jgi:hypothetical protein
MQAMRLAAAFLVMASAACSSTPEETATTVSAAESTTQATAPSLEGVWKGTTSVTTGPNASNNPNRLPNIVTFSKTHYTVVTQDTAVPRPRVPLAPPKDPTNLTDAEKLARYEAWSSVNADGGTYEVQGNTLIQHPFVRKNPPGETGTYADLTFELGFDGNDTHTLTIRSADGKSVTTRTYTRLE